MVYGMVWYGTCVVWCGMIWYGVVWYGMVWNKEYSIQKKRWACFQEITYVGGSSKIQTLCHMTQVLLKLKFTAMDSQVVKVSFLHLQMCK